VAWQKLGRAVNNTLLFVMFGLIGSGKSYFASQLAEKEEIVWLNSDALRAEIYEDPTTVPDGFMRHHVVFSGMRYASQQILKAGKSVIYDANNNKARKRKDLYNFAKQAGAVPILIWIKTPEDVALKRAATRPAAQHNVKVAKEHIDRHKNAQQLPQAEEPLITIDGEADFNTQYQSFQEQLQSLSKNGGKL
jgi:predicted kinase